MLLALVSSAYAHPAPVPHDHGSDLMAYGLLAAWAIAAAAWWAWSRRSAEPVPVRVRARR